MEPRALTVAALAAVLLAIPVAAAAKGSLPTAATIHGKDLAAPSPCAATRTLAWAPTWPSWSSTAACSPPCPCPAGVGPGPQPPKRGSGRPLPRHLPDPPGRWWHRQGPHRTCTPMPSAAGHPHPGRAAQRRWPSPAGRLVAGHPRLSKVLSQVDRRERSLGASVVLDVPDPRVERQVFGHLLVGVEVDGVEPGAPRLGFGELKEGSPSPVPR
jgi:hypothetical protein